MKAKNNNKLDSVYKKFKKSINMNLTDLKKWKNNPASKLASLDRRPINRIIKLLSKKKSDWNKTDIANANKVISYLARAKKIKSRNYVYKNYTKNDIALKNWGYDKNKSFL